MIKEFVERFDAHRDALRTRFKANHPADYTEVVRAVVEALNPDGEPGQPDPDRIHVIDGGAHDSGTLLFVVAEKGYHPFHYWYVRVDYGSSRGDDMLQDIRNYPPDDAPPTDEQADAYMTLALHIVQGLKRMCAP